MWLDPGLRWGTRGSVRSEQVLGSVSTLAETEFDLAGVDPIVEAMMAMHSVALHPMQEEMRRPAIRIGRDAAVAVLHAAIKDGVADSHADGAAQGEGGSVLLTEGDGVHESSIVALGEPVGFGRDRAERLGE
ncbi:MAG: hypothetical protein JWP15_600 [Alphaproteobacteria bacterium]|nr:hypothetical protein [Alphaproteobacteria bacterium]